MSAAAYAQLVGARVGRKENDPAPHELEVCPLIAASNHRGAKRGQRGDCTHLDGDKHLSPPAETSRGFKGPVPFPPLYFSLLSLLGARHPSLGHPQMTACTGEIRRGTSSKLKASVL